MKKYIYLFATILLFSACTSSTKLMQQGNYEAAIYKSVKKLKKKPSKTKEIDVLRESYKITNQQNTDRINFLKKSGEPNVWDEIYENFNIMKRRQEVVSTLPTSVLSQINFIKINYDEEILNAKKKAAEYFYVHAMSLLDKKDKMSARQAYDELLRVKQLYPNYRDVDEMISKAHFMGTNFILFEMRNNTRMVMPKDFEIELLKISLTDLNGTWIQYHTRKLPEIKYDYSIILNLKGISLTPESVEKTKFTEEKEIEDGFKYQLDKAGNVMKDTSGNDIKLPIYKIITCQINETKQFKSCLITGTLDYYNNLSGQLIKTDPVSAEATFNHIATEAFGNLDALKPETRKRVGSKPMPFPPDPEMIMRANEVLKDMCKNIIYRNKDIISY